MNANQSCTKTISRRRILAGATAIGSLTVTGCLDGSGGSGPANGTGPDDGNGGNGQDGDNGESDRTAEAPELVDASIETTGSECGSPDDSGIDVTTTGETIVVTGALQAPNPCHEAVLDDVDLDDGLLQLVVDVRSTTGPAEGCIQCYGKVEYEATVELTDSAGIERVRVDHATGDEYAVELEQASDQG